MKKFYDLLPRLTKNHSVKHRLTFGFGFLIVLLVASGVVSLWQLNQVDDALRRIVTVEEPLEKAVLEMEIHAGETARAILHYMHEPDDKFRAQAHQSEQTFDEYSHQYSLLAENEEEKRLGKQVHATYDEFKELGEELMILADRRRTVFASLQNDVESMTVLLQGFAEAGASQPSPAALQMNNHLNSLLRQAQSCLATGELKDADELRQENENFLSLASSLTPAKMPKIDQGLFDSLNVGWKRAYTALTDIRHCTTQLEELSIRFEDDLFAMDHLLDNVIQPIIQRETVQAAQHAMAASRYAVSLLAGFGLLGVLFGGFVGWHISRGIIQPVLQLLNGSEIIRRGNREYRIQLQTQDEFGDLAQAFNGMVDSINQSTDELLESQKEAERLRLVAAQKEIDHHAAEARTDQLTQLNNRRAFDDMLHHYSECETTEGSFYLALLDVDKFKSFNDRFGHQTGDAVLIHVAQTLAQSFEGPDFVARFGGEEFSILMPNSSFEEAAHKVDAARRAIEEMEVAYDGNSFKVTASGGVAAFTAGEELATVIQNADAALYASKEAGRNCLHVFDPQQGRSIALQAKPSMSVMT